MPPTEWKPSPWRAGWRSGVRTSLIVVILLAFLAACWPGDRGDDARGADDVGDPTPAVADEGGEVEVVELIRDAAYGLDAEQWTGGEQGELNPWALDAETASVGHPAVAVFDQVVLVGWSELVSCGLEVEGIRRSGHVLRIELVRPDTGDCDMIGAPATAVIGIRGPAVESVELPRFSDASVIVRGDAQIALEDATPGNSE